MEGMVAIENSGASSRGAGKFQRGLHRLGSGIGEKHLVEVGHVPQQALGEQAGRRGYVHLD
jgi:hypothetical protein